MKAAVIHKFGGPEVFEYADLPDPQPGPGEVVIEVAACGINRYDLYLRMGAMFQDIAMPHVMGADVAGTIASVGEGVTEFKTGTDVIAAPGYAIDEGDWSIEPENLAPSFEVTGTHTWGGNAKYMRIPARFVLRDRTSLPKEQVAAMPLVLMTSVHAVGTLGEVGPGMKVLIQAGASGSGHACVQVAKALGAEVATTIGSPEKIEMVTACGADLVINRKTEDFTSRVLDWTDGRGVDVVIDNVGASVFAGNMEALRTGGIFVNFGLVGGFETELDLRQMFFRQHQLRGSFMGSMKELRRGLVMLAEKQVKAFVDRTYPLAEVAEAHRYIDSRAVQGKVVLIPS